jgi:hypothetical protein
MAVEDKTCIDYARSDKIKDLCVFNKPLNVTAVNTCTCVHIINIANNVTEWRCNLHLEGCIYFQQI